MAIMPVRSFSQRSNYNVNFEGKKHKEHQVMSRPISTSIKAVPLAALIAMSPMTPVNANPRLENSRNVIELAQEPQPGVLGKEITSNLFFDPNGTETTIGLIAVNSKNDGNYIDKIQGVIDVYSKKYFDVEKYYNIKYQIYNADGTLSKTTQPVKAILVKYQNSDEKNIFTGDDLGEFMDKVLNNPNNKVNIKQENIIRKMRPGLNDRFISISENPSQIEDINYKTANGPVISGKPVNTYTAEGNTGNYVIITVDCDDNIKNGYEAIVINKILGENEYGPAMLVKRLQPRHVVLGSTFGSVKDGFGYGQILVGGGNMEDFLLVDDKLFGFLLAVLKQPHSDNYNILENQKVIKPSLKINGDFGFYLQ